LKAIGAERHFVPPLRDALSAAAVHFAIFNFVR